MFDIEFMFRYQLTRARTNLFQGAEIDVKDSAGRTALTLAVIKGHTPVVRREDTSRCILTRAGSSLA